MFVVLSSISFENTWSLNKQNLFLNDNPNSMNKKCTSSTQTKVTMSMEQTISLYNQFHIGFNSSSGDVNSMNETMPCLTGECHFLVKMLQMLSASAVHSWFVLIISSWYVPYTKEPVVVEDCDIFEPDLKPMIVYIQ